jgi:hypothetical protein
MQRGSVVRLTCQSLRGIVRCTLAGALFAVSTAHPQYFAVFEDDAPATTGTQQLGAGTDPLQTTQNACRHRYLFPADVSACNRLNFANSSRLALEPGSVQFHQEQPLQRDGRVLNLTEAAMDQYRLPQGLKFPGSLIPCAVHSTECKPLGTTGTKIGAKGKHQCSGNPHPSCPRSIHGNESPSTHSAIRRQIIDLQKPRWVRTTLPRTWILRAAPV